jgi:hypothetical protein
LQPTHGIVRDDKIKDSCEINSAMPIQEKMDEWQHGDIT